MGIVISYFAGGELAGARACMLLSVFCPRWSTYSVIWA